MSVSVDPWSSRLRETLTRNRKNRSSLPGGVDFFGMHPVQNCVKRVEDEYDYFEKSWKIDPLYQEASIFRRAAILESVAGDPGERERRSVVVTTLARL